MLSDLQACVSVERAYWHKEWRRLVLSPLHHADDFHLYFNMVSFLWKGIRLERQMGGAWFFYLLSVFSLLTGVVYLLLEIALTELTQEITYSMQCAVGFSGNSEKYVKWSCSLFPQIQMRKKRDCKYVSLKLVLTAVAARH